MLFGEYKHAVDAKNRLFIPAKHREQLGNTFVVIKSTSDFCLSVYSMEEWQKYEEKLASVPNSQAKDLIRSIYRTAIEAEPDSQGRIILTPMLKEYAQIDRNAVIVGCGKYAEIWSDVLYDKKIGEENQEENNQLLKDFGI